MTTFGSDSLISITFPSASASSLKKTRRWALEISHTSTASSNTSRGKPFRGMIAELQTWKITVIKTFTSVKGISAHWHRFAPTFFFFLNFSKTLEFYDLKLLLRCIILGGVLFHTSVLAKNLLHTFKMKNIIIILCVVIKMKPPALFPLFPLIYGKTHPPLQHSCVPTKDGTNLKTAWNWSRNWVWQHCRQPCTDKFC